MQHNDIRLTAGAHTKANRNIEYITQNENSTEEEIISNDNSGIYQTTNYGDVYAGVHTVNTNTNAVLPDLQLTEDEPITTRPLVVVAIRGSVTREDWFNNVLTQLYPLDNKFDDLKDTVEEKLTSFVPNLSDSIILITGHSLGAVIANLFAAQRYPTYRRCTYYSIS